MPSVRNWFTWQEELFIEPINSRPKNFWLAISMCANLGILGFFNYYNFFAKSWIQAISELGYHPEPWTIQVILPVGISFYTFQTMSYTLDVYKGKLEATKDFFSFATFVSFFPQFVARTD